MARRLTVKQQERAAEKVLARLYGAHCRGQIGVMDIGKVFDVGRAAYWAFEATSDEREAAARAAMVTRFAELRCDGETS